jgi:hypothetical protein
VNSKIRLTKRGYRLLIVVAAAGFLTVWGFAGWLENLGM